MARLTRSLASLLALSLLTLAIGCDGGGTSPEEAVATAILKISGDQQAGVVAEALPQPLVVEVQDQNSSPMSGVMVGWSVTSGGGSVSAGSSTTDAQGRATTELTLGTDASATHQVAATVAGAGTASFSATAEPGPASVVAITPGEAELNAIGATVELSAAAEDAFGNPVEGVAIGWSELDDAIVTVDDAGTATAVANGTGRVVAAAEEGADTAEVTVRQVATGVAIAESPETLNVAATLGLTATATDANGVAIPDPEVAWSSGLDAVATIDGDGTVTGVAPGPVDVMAELDGVSAARALTVLATASPTFAAVAPATLAPGATATITGDGFSPVPDANAVQVAGIDAEVIAATGTELQVTLPKRGAFPCQATQDVAVSVAVPGANGATSHPLAVAVQHNLAVGEAAAGLAGPDAGCNELAVTGGSYLVAVFNADSDPTNRVTFTLAGEAAPAGAAAGMGAPSGRSALARRDATRGSIAAVPVRTVPGFGAGLEPWAAPAGLPDGSAAAAGAVPTDAAGALAGLESLHRSPEAHQRMMEASRRLIERLPARAFRRTLRRADVPLLADEPPEVGDEKTMRIPNMAADDPCADFDEVVARVAYSGTHVVILEDVDAPLAGTMDDHIAAAGAEFDDIMFPILADNFGDPLVLDSSLDDNDRILLVLSEVVNDANVAGVFAWPGDLAGRGSCEQSNEAEVLYSVVPTDPGDGFSSNQRNGWLWSVPSLFVHNGVHLVTMAQRIAAGMDPAVDPFIAEGTANVGEELYGRVIYGYERNGNTGYGASIFNEVRPGAAGAGMPIAADGDLDPVRLILYPIYYYIYAYLQHVYAYSILGPSMVGDYAYRGAGWLLLRFIMDSVGLGPVVEAAFLHAVIQQASLAAGVAAIQAIVGAPFFGIMAAFALAFYIDDLGLPNTGLFSLATWNIRSIFAGLNHDFPLTFPVPHPMVAFYLAFGLFGPEILAIPGGAAAIFYLAGAQATIQLLRLTAGEGAGGGGALPEGLGISIIRLN